MKIRVLGSAAGGGFPQWNCNCRNCAGVRHGTLQARRRTQSSIAVSSDGLAWVLINASPDILAQLHTNSVLQPARTVRDTGIEAILLTDAQVDHVTGLFMLREATEPLELWCTNSVFVDLTNGNPVANVLNYFCGVRHRAIVPSQPFAIESIVNATFTAVGLSSKAPPYSPHREAPHDDDNIAVHIVDTASGNSIFYAPGLGAMAEATWQRMYASNCVLVDGTFWSDDEMIRLGLSKKAGREIGHLPLSGENGMVEWLGRLPTTTRKILIHINNTNPILDERSLERAKLAECNIEVAFDGMEIEL
jgi:pyrroloquinoline quinone biosynthesis protein B